MRTRQRLRLKASRNEGLSATVSALALIMPLPMERSLAQKGMSPQRMNPARRDSPPINREDVFAWERRCRQIRASVEWRQTGSARRARSDLRSGYIGRTYRTAQPLSELGVGAVLSSRPLSSKRVTGWYRWVER